MNGFNKSKYGDRYSTVSSGVINVMRMEKSAALKKGNLYASRED